MDFLFFWGIDSLSRQIEIKNFSESFWGEVGEIKQGSLLILFPKHDTLDEYVNTNELLGLITGWGGVLFEYDKTLEKFYRAIDIEWPVVHFDITGCFSGVLFNKKERKFKIFSDPSGINPLYYSKYEKGLIGGTSLILLGKILASKIDLVGVLQVLSPPDFVNFGKRTILSEIKRVMPGELLEFDIELKCKIFYDDTLFRNGEKGDVRDEAENLWEIIKEDVTSCFSKHEDINIAMSGGWDSRIIAGALLNSNKNIKCLTYGRSTNEYEVRLARRCAEIVNADFEFCDIYPSYFPTYERFLENMRSTENTLITSWFSLLDKRQDNYKEPIGLGDMFEVVVGRNIKALTSRGSRLSRQLKPKETGRLLVKADNKSYELWSTELIDKIVKSQIENLDKINPNFVDKSLSELREGLVSDIQVTLERIRAHNLEYTVLYDELFAWYSHGLSMGRQFLCLKEKFIPLAPTMGIKVLRAASSIDPVVRADNKLLHEIQSLPELSSLSALPSAAIPFVPSSSPLWIKNLVWATRSILDQRLIKRAMKKKKLNARMRMINTYSLVELYNHPELEQRIESWFSSYKFIEHEHYIDIARKRANFEAWPLINTDIVAPASLCIFFDLLFSKFT